MVSSCDKCTLEWKVYNKGNGTLPYLWNFSVNLSLFFKKVIKKKKRIGNSDSYQIHQIELLQRLPVKQIQLLRENFLTTQSCQNN